jgi:nitrite reductase/ring-hydroxylating ferredoxin subunit
VTLLCRLDEIADQAAKGFEIARDGETVAIFVVRRGGRALGYVNQCAHLSVPLEWQPDKFLTPDGRHILCSMHGALFQIEDGLCVAGPCLKKSLKSVPLDVYNGEIRLLD